MEEITVKPIAHIENGYQEKFGIPRQSGIIEEVKSKIVFAEEYRVKDAFRGLEAYSHLWLIWQFSTCADKDWSPTVRPPRLGGNQRMGVFATRSPFRPNHMGLSCVKLLKIDWDDADGPCLWVSGADLRNGTPILDVKPYLAYIDSVPEATNGFALDTKEDLLEVRIPDPVLYEIPACDREAIRHILAQDPRPAYQNDEERIYYLKYDDCDVWFQVKGKTLTVTDACHLPPHKA